jgi:hypothetical protein
MISFIGDNNNLLWRTSGSHRSCSAKENGKGQKNKYVTDKASVTCQNEREKEKEKYRLKCNIHLLSVLEVQ